jgi:hypothetical protein
MSKITSAAAVLVVGLFMVGLLAVPVSAITPTATAPHWQVGDTWAMGKEVDLGSDLTDNITNLNQLLMTANITIDDLDVDSTVAAYVLFSVDSETATTYTLTAKMAVKFATQANVKVTAQLPVAGTYDADENAWFGPSSIPKATKVITLDLTEKLGIVLSATAIVDKTSSAVKQVDWEMSSAMVLDMDATNIPEISTNGTQQTIGYKNYDVGLDLVAEANLTMQFTPALDIYQFPFSQGETWTTNNSMVTVNGAVGGFFDAHGLTADQEEQIFTEDLKNATGATSFPISFDHLTSEDGEITDGQFGPYYGNISSMGMKCLSGITKTLGGIQTDVFVIQVDEGTKMFYSSGLRVLGISADPDNLELPDEASIITGMIGAQDMEMDPVTVSTATSSIDSIEAYTKSVATQAGAKASDSGTLGDFFLKAPYIGIIMVVVAALVVAALVFVGLRARKP